jgi:putative iron-dependent peroxidase
LTPLTEAAIFLVLTVETGGADAVPNLLADSAGVVRSVGFRDRDGQLSCVV